MGHIADRTFEWDYISSPYNTQGKKPAWINWAAEAPAHTAVKFQVRVAKTEATLVGAAWMGSRGPGSYFTKRGSKLGHLPEGNWIQYRVVLDTGNGAISPIVSAVEIAFD